MVFLPCTSLKTRHTHDPLSIRGRVCVSLSPYISLKSTGNLIINRNGKDQRNHGHWMELISKESEFIVTG